MIEDKLQYPFFAVLIKEFCILKQPVCVVKFFLTFTYYR
jgi:hypothetical protein